MKSKLRKKIAIGLGLFLMVLLLVGLGVGAHLIHEYPADWEYGKTLPGPVKRLIIELETERQFHRLFPPKLDPERWSHVTADTLEQRMRLGADWLLRMQESSGRFRYWYDPVADRFSDTVDDNFLRQAGTAYSLALIWEMTADERYLAGALANLDYLMLFEKRLDEDKSYFLFRGMAKLGGIALPMLTMLKARELTGTREYDEILRRLANMVLHLQSKYSTGQFKSSYVYGGDYEYEEHTGWQSRIYPGEAMLALAWMYRAFGDSAYKNGVDRGLEFYSIKNRWRHHLFLSWTISAFVSMYERSPEAQYADYVFVLADHLLTQQNLDSGDEVYGSFHSFPSANTGLYLEGLNDAIHLAEMAGDLERAAHYRQRALMAYRWLLWLQYDEESSAGLANPEMAVGGVRRDIANPMLRIDNTQHVISGYAKGLRRVFGVEPALRRASD